MKGSESLFASLSAAARIERAFQEVFAICRGSRKWTMRVPVEPTDSDEVIADGLIVARDLDHNTRRMLQALDAYWLGYEGLPKGRNPRGKYDSADWWNRYERYRAKVEAVHRGE